MRTEQWDFSILSEIGFFARKMGFPKKTLKFPKMAKAIKFAVENNWKSKISQNVQTFGTYKTITGFCEKSWIYFELKLAVFSKRSQNLGFFIKKDRFSEKLWTFLRKTKGSNFAVEGEWKSKVYQNVQNLFCFQKVEGVSREKFLNRFVKWLKVANLPQNRMNQ